MIWVLAGARDKQFDIRIAVAPVNIQKDFMALALQAENVISESAFQYNSIAVSARKIMHLAAPVGEVKSIAPRPAPGLRAIPQINFIIPMATIAFIAAFFQVNRVIAVVAI